MQQLSVLFLCLFLLIQTTPSVIAGVAEDIAALAPGYWYEIDSTELEDSWHDWSGGVDSKATSYMPTCNSLGNKHVMAGWSGWDNIWSVWESVSSSSPLSSVCPISSAVFWRSDFPVAMERLPA